MTHDVIDDVADSVEVPSKLNQNVSYSPRSEPSTNDSTPGLHKFSRVRKAVGYGAVFYV